MDKLVKYNKNLKWSEVIDHNNKVRSSKHIEYESDEDSDKTESQIDSNHFLENFSLDNEKILEKINNIISENNKLDKHSSLDLLRDEKLVITYLSKYVIQNNSLDFNFFTKLLSWCQSCSEHLARRIGLRKFSHNLTNLKGNNSVPRSSYKFCSYRDGCSYNYDNKKRGCHKDHYVHHIVAADIESLIRYVEANFDKNNFNHTKEIIKCVNTIAFVIKHMYEELNNICYYSKKSECEKLHRNHTAQSSKKKQNKPRNVVSDNIFKKKQRNKKKPTPSD